jgi:ribosomal-protein-alanine N-acetyltransferase
MHIPELVTKRLRLRPIEMSDAPGIRSLLHNEPEIAANGLGIPYPYPEGEETRFVQKLQDRQKNNAYTWAILGQTNHELMGMISLGLHVQYDSGELGYWLGKAYWNQGYTTEAVKCVIRYGFEERALNRIFAESFSENTGSRRVLEKSGMTQEGRLRQHIKHWNGTYKDVYHYGILASEYNHHSSHLSVRNDVQDSSTG